MKIVQDERFKVELKEILSFISKDSIAAAKKLNQAIREKVNALPHNPKKYKKLQPLNNDNIRVLVVKGYSIPYLIDEAEQNIVVLGIFNINLWDL